MEIIIVAGFFILAQTCFGLPIENEEFTRDAPRSAGAEEIFTEMAYRDKRGNKEEPTCEELRAMWIYSKRQSRAAETTNDLPMYRDPFAHNVWDTYPIRSSNSLVYRENNPGHARSRSGGSIIFGKVVHKAPPGSRFRSGMQNRMKALEEIPRFYGTINRQMPDQRRRQTNFRSGGNGVPQAGSFQRLKELIRTERARELQEQRTAAEMVERAPELREAANADRRLAQESRRPYMNSVPTDPKKNYVYEKAGYVPSLASNFDDGLLPSEEYDRNSMLHQ